MYAIIDEGSCRIGGFSLEATPWTAHTQASSKADQKGGEKPLGAEEPLSCTPAATRRPMRVLCARACFVAPPIDSEPRVARFLRLDRCNQNYQSRSRKGRGEAAILPAQIDERY